jgi:pyruvate/2-oxoglutarate dehydrogenase complex dihydrolipoamide acyltransferase (E2) component
MTAIRIPDDLWDTEDIPEGAIGNWLYEDGESVRDGTTVVTVMAGKTEYDVPAPASGTLRIEAEPDSSVTPGMVIGHVK